MKRILQLSFFALALLAGQNLNAQFLEKLGKKLGDTVENTVINKTAKKAEKETGNAMDEVLEPGKSDKKKSKSKSKQEPKNKTNPSGKSSSGTSKSAYDFSYQYQLTIKTAQGEMMMDYFIQPKESYLGAKMSMSGMEQFMIFENDQTHTFMDMNGMKIKQTTNSLDFAGDVDYDQNDYKVSEIPGKTILGYKCKGMKMENDEYEFKIYYTNDAPFGFTNSQQMFPEKFKSHVNENSLMMEMQMIDKKKSKNNATMLCTLAKENKFNFSTQGYQSF